MTMTNFQDKVGFIWFVAELLRGDYKHSEYGKVILPFTVLRRLDSVLGKTKAKPLLFHYIKRGQELPSTNPELEKTYRRFAGKPCPKFLDLADFVDKLRG